MNIYPFIEAEKAEQDGNVAMACRLLEVSRTAYYEWSSTGPSARELSDGELTERIKQIHSKSGGRYGHPASPTSCETTASVWGKSASLASWLLTGSWDAASAASRRPPSPIRTPRPKPSTSFVATSVSGYVRSTPPGAATSPIRLSSRLCAAARTDRGDRWVGIGHEQ